MESLIDLIFKGGPIMFALFLISILSLFIIVLKIIHFSKFTTSRMNLINKTGKRINKNNLEETLLSLKIIPHPAARIMEATINSLNMTKNDREAEIDRVALEQLSDLKTWLKPLELIATLSPLLGLLGTVIGMIESFANLEAAGSRVNPSILAGGIWEALLTTAFGLIVAIPALAAFTLFESKVEKIRLEMINASTLVLTATIEFRGK